MQTLQSRPKMEWEPHVKGPSSILHVGLGVPGRWNREVAAFTENWPGIPIVGIDASPNFCKEAKDRGYPGSVRCFAAWDLESELDFHCIDIPQGPAHPTSSSSVFKDPDAVTVRIRVPAKRIDSLKKELIGNDIFMHLDVEGSELKALMGASGLTRRNRIKWIYTEMNKSEFRPGQVVDIELQRYLSDIGMHCIESFPKPGWRIYNELWGLNGAQ